MVSAKLFTTFSYGSRAVTITVTAPPVFVVAGAVMVRCVAAAALTVVLAVAVRPELLVSLARIVIRAARVSVAWKEPLPFVSFVSPGSVAVGSLLVK